MISIIICSRKSTISKLLDENIRSTIGCAYELIIIDNSNNKFSIFSAYNEGVRRAKYKYLCFMHDDILFKSQDWGLRVIKHFSNTDFSIIGIAGLICILKMPGIFLDSGDVYWNLLQSNHNETNTIHLYNNPLNVEIQQVNVVDGVWICIKKELFNKIQFDEYTYSGFHFYDYDVCMQGINNGFKVAVIYDILIEHFSYGFKDKGWIENSSAFAEKWSHLLPIGLEKNDEITCREMLGKALLKYKSVLENNHYSPEYIDGFMRKHFRSIYPILSKRLIISFIKYYILGSKMSNYILSLEHKYFNK